MKANFHCARLHYLCCCKHKTRNYGTDYNQYPDFGLDNGGTVGLHLMLKKDCKAGFDVILTECPSLRILGYSGYGGQLLDVSKNPLLEFIDFSAIRNEKLDFSANLLLEELHIDGSEDLVSLNLSKNDKLRRLDIFMCHNLQHLALSNQSQLNEVDFALTHLRPKDLEYLEKTLKRNAPYKVRGGSFSDDKIIEVCNGKIVGEYEGKL